MKKVSGVTQEAIKRGLTPRKLESMAAEAARDRTPLRSRGEEFGLTESQMKALCDRWGVRVRDMRAAA